MSCIFHLIVKRHSTELIVKFHFNTKDLNIYDYSVRNYKIVLYGLEWSYKAHVWQFEELQQLLNDFKLISSHSWSILINRSVLIALLCKAVYVYIYILISIKMLYTSSPVEMLMSNIYCIYTSQMQHIIYSSFFLVAYFRRIWPLSVIVVQIFALSSIFTVSSVNKIFPYWND
jgi:hypothetical protein